MMDGLFRGYRHRSFDGFASRIVRMVSEWFAGSTLYYHKKAERETLCLFILMVLFPQQRPAFPPKRLLPKIGSWREHEAAIKVMAAREKRRKKKNIERMVG